ncbi:hypothetical protein HON52_01485 [Candidatus Uhrbacteria bacterium]|jgi:hypothetical protein|nr:hypothetical protein [Candidatus Uhrbacteria bacterium]
MRPKTVELELANDEEIVAIVRESFIARLPRIFLVALWLLVPFFFFFPLLALGPIGLLVFVCLAVSGILYALREWHLWYYTMWVVTDKRIIDVDQLSWTLFEMHEILLKKIRRVHITRSTLGAKILRYATVWIETSSNHAFDIELDGVRRPKHLKRLLHDLHKMKKQS